MSALSPLWGSVLDHVCMESANPRALAQFYADALRMNVEKLGGGTLLVQGPNRTLLIQPGSSGSQPFAAWRMESQEQLDAFKERLGQSKVEIEDSPTPLFSAGFAVRDPDQRLAVFGIARGAPPSPTAAEGPAARLQHVVVATSQLGEMRRFYSDKVGFRLSDTVFSGTHAQSKGEPHVHFLRSDAEHHSFAMFAASTSRHDHHCYETGSWNDIRDWLDHLGNLDITPWWGPGRHGPGNNTFFMIKDADGNNVELSAELETGTELHEAGEWLNTRKMYNLWGAPWQRQ
ncbi:MAG: VOC family protein [Pirellulales bacterium]